MAQHWVGRGFEGGRNTREVFYLATACLGIEAFHIATLALFNRSRNVDFLEVVGTDDVGSHLSQFLGGTDEGSNGDDARVDKKFGHFGNASDVFLAVVGRKSQVGIDAATYVVAVENAAKQSATV